MSRLYANIALHLDLLWPSRIKYLKFINVLAKKSKGKRSSKGDLRDLSQYSTKSTRIVTSDYLLLAGPGSWLHSAINLGSTNSKSFAKGVTLEVASDTPSQVVRIPVDGGGSYQHYRTATSITLSESSLLLSAKPDVVKAPSVLLESAKLDFGRGDDLMEVSKHLTIGREPVGQVSSIVFGDGADILRITGAWGLYMVNGEVSFGSGDDRLEVQMISFASGNPASQSVINLGDGNDVITGKAFGSFVALNAGAGDDVVAFDAFQMNTINQVFFDNGYRAAAFDLGSGDDILSGSFSGEVIDDWTGLPYGNRAISEARLGRAAHVDFGDGKDVWRLPGGSYEVLSASGSFFLIQPPKIGKNYYGGYSFTTGVRVSGLEAFQALDGSGEIPFSVGQFLI